MFTQTTYIIGNPAQNQHNTAQTENAVTANIACCFKAIRSPFQSASRGCRWAATL